MSNPVYNGSDKRLKELFENGGGGGGGTTVVANPSGEATDELEKLQVGETIYDIPTGGGGSSTLAGLDDVNLSSPTDGQVLTYNNGDWVNANGGGSGGSGGTCYLNTMYSTTEKKVGYWIDGKSLYAKTIHKEYNELVDYGIRKCVALDVANTSIKYVEATATSATYGRAYLGTEDYASDNTDSNYMKVNSYYSMVAVSIGGTGSNWNDYQPTVDATFYYTKNSDTAEPHPQNGEVIYLPEIYSEEERQIGFWEDGKPTYQKTFKLGDISGTSNSRSLGLANIDNLRIVSEGSYFVNSTGSGILPVPYTHPTQGNSVGIFFEKTSADIVIQFRIASGMEGNVRDFTITLQYTKTTDTAEPHPPYGSILYLPTMYSERERQIGYWKDGKPLYQKTYAGLSLECNDANTWYNTNILLGDIDVITNAELVDAHRQFIAGVVGTMSERTYLGVYLSISGRTITTITIQYTKTTDTADVNPQAGGAIYLPQIYSNIEKQIGTWVDGKPLYQKTVYKLNQQSSFSDYVNFAELSDVDTVVSMLYNVNRGGIWMTAVSGNRPELNNTNYFFGVRYYDGYIQYRIDTYGTQITDMYVTIQYTKTTDSVGSSPWTPTGGQSAHYSTNEQVVGTWIDGKTLYEATIEVNNPTKQTFGNYYSYDANYSGHNIDYVQCIAKQCHDAHDQRWYDLPYHRLIDTESILCQAMKADSTGQYSFAVFFRTSEQYNIDKIRYTIQYTKSS